MCLRFIKLPHVDDGGGAVGRQLEGVDEGGVAVAVHAHGALPVNADKQRPEGVVQQGRNAARLKVDRRHILPQLRIAAHRPTGEPGI